MPTWGAILQELQQAQQAIVRQIQAGNPPPTVSPFDVVRRKYLAALSHQTRRSVILYASKWTQPPVVETELISVSVEDVRASWK